MEIFRAILSVLPILFLACMGFLFMFVDIKGFNETVVKYTKTTHFCYLLLFILLGFVSSFASMLVSRIVVIDLETKNKELKMNYEMKIQEIIDSGKEDTIQIGDKKIIFKLYNHHEK